MNKSEVRFKIFGAVYIPLQFLTVWIIYFGFTLEPGPLQLVGAFNVPGIIRAALDFWQLVPVAFASQSTLIFLIISLWYVLCLLWQCWRVVIFIIAAWQLVNYIFGVISHFMYDGTVDIKIAFVIKYGAPGNGKSSSAGYDANLLARKMWKEVCYKYWLMKPQVKKWKNEGSHLKLKEWYEIQDAYIFWSTQDCIPCLASNIPLEYRGQKSIVLTRDHIYQKKRLPAFTVLYIDEISAMVDVTNSGMDRPLEVTELFRWARHFGFLVVATEQDKERVQIDMRRVAGQTFLMLNQKAICKPIPILFINVLLKLFPAFLGYDKPRIVLTSVIRFLDKLLVNTGFRKFKYRLADTETGSGQKSRKKTFCLPSALGYNYDDRTFRDFYKPLNEPLSYDIFDSLKMSKEQKEAFIHKTKSELTMENEEFVSLARLVYSIPESGDKADNYLNQQKKELNLVSKLFDDEVFSYMKRVVDEAEFSKEKENKCLICGKSCGKYIYCKECFSKKSQEKRAG